MRERTGGAARLPIVAALVAVACAVPATAAHAATSAEDTDTVVALVNQEREEAGCDPVSVESHLTEAAQDHSQDQADMGKMTHTGSDGSRVGERATRAGYEWSKVGENVASGTTSPERVMSLWMNSEAHRENILNCAYEDIGVARVDGYWTQDFGTPR
ncbi:CAP domain-containing protein [Pseudonocardia sp. DLS-67]